MRMLAAALAASALAASAGAATTPSGLRGVVMRGPVTPVCVAEQPCYVRAKGVTLAFVRNGRVVRRAKTDAQGRYRVALAAGRYAVRVAGRVVSVGRGLEPDTVRVGQKGFRRVDFSIDTGIR
jgi:hypothetical protein